MHIMTIAALADFHAHEQLHDTNRTAIPETCPLHCQLVLRNGEAIFSVGEEHDVMAVSHHTSPFSHTPFKYLIKMKSDAPTSSLPFLATPCHLPKNSHTYTKCLSIKTAQIPTPISVPTTTLQVINTISRTTHPRTLLCRPVISVRRRFPSVSCFDLLGKTCNPDGFRWYSCGTGWIRAPGNRWTGWERQCWTFIIQERQTQTTSHVKRGMEKPTLFQNPKIPRIRFCGGLASFELLL
ncbi:hypothetical protein EDD15DRAFT_2292352 [Pisolithus albus]|nr:hypothetical protein EDD15DRAFT_2292352 [Pisolithus albus]